MKNRIYIFFFLFSAIRLYATHIVGGELIYDYLGNDQYKITLKIYRDCGANGAPFDGNGINVPGAYITIYDGENNYIARYDMGKPEVTKVPSAFNNPCLFAPNNVCVEEGIYTHTLTLPQQPGGYTLIYQRCCRNAGIINLVNSVLEGATYFAKIPGPEEAADNSSPRFAKFPPLFICQGLNYTFDHAAVDPDGDKLVYTLCPPYTGLDGCCPSLGLTPNPPSSVCISPPPSCPPVASPPPFSNVVFSPPFSGTYPIPSSPVFSINPVTGQLAGTPTLTGQYVVGVCVQEFRDNKLIDTHFRDFQFTVINCTVSAKSIIAESEKQCIGNVITFTNQSINQSVTPEYHWDFGVPELTTDTSSLFNPTYTYQDTGIYVVTLITNPGKPCTDTLRQPVFVYPPLKLFYKAPERQCLKDNAFDFKAEGSDIPQTTYFWDFTQMASPNISTIKEPAGVSFTEPGLFFVKVNAEHFSCRDSFMDSVRVLARPKARINNIQTNLCEPALVGFSNGSFSDFPLNYFWDFGNGNTSADFEPVASYTAAGTYTATLIVETTQICRDTSVAVLSDIVVLPKPPVGFNVTPKETSIMDPLISINSSVHLGVTSATFSFGDGQSSHNFQNFHTYRDTGTYTIRYIVSNEYGCRDSTVGYVRILPDFRFWMPNAFTPDNNGRNDVFMPVSIGLSQYEFEIFNRWGALIFKTNDPQEGWNGSYKGKPCEQGIYVWKISFKNVVHEQTEKHVGHVSLLRNP